MAGLTIRPFEEVLEEYTKAVFTKAKFLEGIRTMMKAMISGFPEEVFADLDFDESNLEELLDLVTADYEPDFENFRSTFKESVAETYTPQELDILLDIQHRYPWIRDKAIEQLKLSTEKDRIHSQRIGERIQETIERYFESNDSGILKIDTD